MMIREELMWDILDSNADIIYYIDREGFNAEKPVIHIFGRGSLGHLPKKKSHKFTVWFGRGIERWSFKTLKESKVKAEELLSKSTIPITPRIVKRKGRRF